MGYPGGIVVKISQRFGHNGAHTHTHTHLAIQVSAFPHFFLPPSPLTISPLFSFLSISLHLYSVSFSFPVSFCLCFGLASVMADSFQPHGL